MLPLGADTGTRVTSGALMFASGVGVIDIAGQSNFRMRSRVDDVGGIFVPENQCSDVDCVPGATVNLQAKWSGLDLRGTLVFKGDSYVLGQEGAGGALGLVDFEGSLQFTRSADGSAWQFSNATYALHQS